MASFLRFFHSLSRVRDISPATRLIALTIGGHCKPVSGDGAYPAVRTIARKTALGKSTVSRSIRWLSANGWLEVTPNTGFGRGWRRFRYRLSIPGNKVSQPVGHDTAPAPYRNKDNVLRNGGGAIAAWKKVREAAGRFGAYRLEERKAFLGDCINQALDRIGGFVPRICRAMQGDLAPGGPVFREFEAAYNR